MSYVVAAPARFAAGSSHFAGLRRVGDATGPDTVHINPVRPDDPACETLAAMHAACLPHSVLSLLGGEFLGAFYRFAARGPVETVLAARDGDEAVAGALVSRRPATLNRRALFATPLAWAVLRHLHRAPVRQAVFGNARIAWDDPAWATEPEPELLEFFCRADRRGRGFGGALVAHVDRLLAAEGIGRYFVRTTDAPDNRALKFYRGHGFVPVGRIDANGVRFALLMKTLCNADRPQ